jgi:hypothetical protein
MLLQGVFTELIERLGVKHVEVRRYVYCLSAIRLYPKPKAWAKARSTCCNVPMHRSLLS